jgi:surfeit locus 1 family protein
MVEITGERIASQVSSRSRSGLALLVRLFNRRWWWSTLVVLLGMAFLARLGVWQLDRLDQRRARNAELVRQLALAPLPLGGQPLPADLSSLKNRPASARGEFDFSRQVALQYQNWMDAPGIHLVAPLVMEDTGQAVLVDRGWLPADQAAPETWSQYDERGPVTVTGLIQLSQTLPGGADQAAQPAPAEFKSEWYRVEVEAIQAQMPYDLLPIYLLQSPTRGDDATLPYQVEPEIDLSDGPHLGYAIQWFIFAIILGIVYVSYVRKKVTG